MILQVHKRVLQRKEMGEAPKLELQGGGALWILTLIRNSQCFFSPDHRIYENSFPTHDSENHLVFMCWTIYLKKNTEFDHLKITNLPWTSPTLKTKMVGEKSCRCHWIVWKEATQCKKHTPKMHHLNKTNRSFSSITWETSLKHDQKQFCH